MENYTARQRWLHWTVAGLVLIQFLVGWALAQLPPGPESAGELRRLAALHGGTGTLIFVLMLVRLQVRQKVGAPPPPNGTPGDIAWLARLNHRAFYVVLLIQPVLGWLAANAAGLQLSFFGLIALPSLVDADTASAEQLGRLHGGVAFLLLCLIGLHLAGVLYHSMVRRDDLLRRMTGS